MARREPRRAGGRGHVGGREVTLELDDRGRLAIRSPRGPRVLIAPRSLLHPRVADLAEVDHAVDQLPISREQEPPPLGLDPTIHGDEDASIEDQPGRIATQEGRVKIDAMILAADLRDQVFA